MRTLLAHIEHDRWRPVPDVIEQVAIANRTLPSTVRTSLRRLDRRALVAVMPRSAVLPDLGGNMRLVRRLLTDADDETIAQHAALVRLVFDELIATRGTLEAARAGAVPRDWWQARDFAEELRLVLGRLVGRRELRRLLAAAGYPGDTPFTKPMPLYEMFEAEPA
jgi:hypothetical protein